MMQINSRSWVAGGWLVALVAAASIAANYVSLVGLLAIVVIGAAPLVVLLVLARRPAQTTAEAIRAVVRSANTEG